MWTMALAFIALVLGFVLVLFSDWTLPSFTARYMAISVLAVMDSALGALRASAAGDYDRTLFITGLLMNTTGAAALVVLGDLLGVDLYLAAVFGFGYRILQNLGVLRRHLVLRWRQRLAPRNQAAASSSPATQENVRRRAASAALTPTSAVDDLSSE